MLQDQEVLDRGRHLGGGRQRHRSVRIVRRHEDAVHLRVVGDPQQLADAPGVADVRLAHVDRLLFEPRAEVPARDHALAQGDPDPREAVLEPRRGGHRVLVGGLLHEQRGERLQPLQQPMRGLGIEHAGRVDHQRCIVAEDLPQPAHVGHRHFRLALRVERPADAAEAVLEGVETQLAGAAGRIFQLHAVEFGSGTDVAAHPFPHPAAEQLEHRQPRRLAGDVPQGLVDAAHGAAVDHPAAPPELAEAKLPDALDLGRIHTQQARPELAFHVRLDRQLVVLGGRLAHPLQAGIGVDLDEHPVAVRAASGTRHGHHRAAHVGNLHSAHA